MKYCTAFNQQYIAQNFYKYKSNIITGVIKKSLSERLSFITSQLLKTYRTVTEWKLNIYNTLTLRGLICWTLLTSGGGKYLTPWLMFSYYIILHSFTLFKFFSSFLCFMPYDLWSRGWMLPPQNNMFIKHIIKACANISATIYRPSFSDSTNVYFI